MTPSKFGANSISLGVMAEWSVDDCNIKMIIDHPSLLTYVHYIIIYPSK